MQYPWDTTKQYKKTREKYIHPSSIFKYYNLLFHICGLRLSIMNFLVKMLFIKFHRISRIFILIDKY